MKSCKPTYMVKPPPPPAPPAKKRELGEFTYHCHKCDKEHKHVTGYLFMVVVEERVYFCNVNCYDEWMAAHPAVKDPRGLAPPPDRRGAVAATRAKNAEAT